jgi:hypothetical protein
MTACVCCVLAAATAQQTPPPASPSDINLPRLLEATDPQSRAWGAWITSRDNIPSLIPALIRTLERALEPGSSEPARDEWLVPVVVADALIQLRALVPAAVLARMPDSLRTQRLILLTMAGPDAAPQLVTIVDRESGLRWFTAANVLVGQQSPSIARLLLRGLRLEATLVVSPGGSVQGGQVGSLLGTVGNGAGGVARGFPPIAWYRFSPARPGAVVVSTGPTPTYYTRDVSTPGFSPAMNTYDTGGPTDDDRLAYLSALLRSPSPITRAHESFSLASTTQAAVDAEVARIREDLRRRHAALVRMLVTGNLLSEDDARTLTPTIDVRVQQVKDRP